MNQKNDNWDAMLLEYIDGTLPAEKVQEVNNALADSPALKNRLEELREVVTLLQQATPVTPSKNFTQSVMTNLGRYSPAHQLPIRHGIMLLIGIMVALVLMVVLIGSGIFDTPATINLNEFITEPQLIKQPLPSIPVDGKLLVNGIIVLNMALAFLVIDRVLFRPWLERRSQAGMHSY